MNKFIYILVLLLIIGLFTNTFAQERSNVNNIVTEDDNLDGWIDAFDIYMSNSIDDDGGATDWVALNAAGINSDFIVGGSYALTIDYLDTGETAGDNIFRAHISMPSNLGTGFTGDITLWYISNPARRIWDIYGEYLETFTPQPVFDGASPLLIELNTFDTDSDEFVDKIKVRFTEPLNPTWFPQGAFDDPTTIFHFTDGIFFGIPLEHYGFETTVLPNDTYVMHIPDATLLNGGNPTVGYVPMLPRVGFTNTMLDNPFALRDPMANLAVYGGGPYIEEAITRAVGADTYIDVFFSEDINPTSVDISDFEVVLDNIGQTVLSFTVNGSIVTLEVAGIPPFLTGVNRLRLTATLCIEDINGNQNTVITWVNIKDGISPSVVDLTPSDLLITDVDDGIDFTLTIDYNEDMDTGIDPTITFPNENPLNTITFNYGNWSDADTYVAHYDVIDVGETVPDIDLLIEDALDIAGNTQFPYDEADVFSINTENPLVVSVTPDPALITDADAGAGNFTVTVVYDEDMDMATNPTIVFAPDVSSTLSNASPSWSNTTTFVMTYDVTDAGVEVDDIDITVDNAIDDVGNIQVPYTEPDAFDIDTENPFVTALTPDPALITDPLREIFTLTVDYSEDMDPGTDPTITFPNEDPTNTITLNYGVWSDPDTYVAYYDIGDIGETVWNIDVCIDDAIDDPAGNIQIPYCEDDVFSIDTQNPEVVSVTPDPDLITDADVGAGNFTVTVEYNEDMDPGTYPIITFPVENPLNTITFNYGNWLYPDTYIAYYNVIDAGETVPNIDLHVYGALDLTGNIQVPYTEPDAFDIDTENPTVVSVVADPPLVTAMDDTFTLTVTYIEDMDPGTNPTIVFNPDVTATLTNPTPSWPNATTFVMTYDVVDIDYIFYGISLCINDAIDSPAGNTQIEHCEYEFFSINTDGPEVIQLVADPIEITDADVGDNNFTLSITYDEPMIADGSADPVITFPVENPLNTITFSYGIWELCDYYYEGEPDCYDYCTYVAYYDVIDVNETVLDIDVHIEGAISKYSGNYQDPYDEADVFSIDTENPLVVSITPDPVLITDADDGTNAFTLTLEYSEVMLTDGTSDPVITFPVEDPLSTITFNNGAWLDADTYVAYYDVVDVGETLWNIDVHVVGAKDYTALNIQVPYDEADIFSIDMENPTVVSLTPNLELISDSEVGTNTFTLTLEYSEDMDGTLDPAITFPVENPLSTIIFNYGSWPYTDTYVAYYDVVDAGVTLPDIDVHVEGAEDVSGNTPVVYDESDVFSIDTENPEVISMILSDQFITDADIGSSFTVTVEYSEEMDPGINPTIVFVPDVSSTLTNPSPLWTNATTFVITYDVADAGVDVEDIDVTVSNAEDDPAGNIQVPYTETDAFEIDTENPTVISLTPNPVLITDSDVGFDTFTITVDFSEDMFTGVRNFVSGDPEITFPVEDPLNTITFTYGNWLDNDTYVAYYDVIDDGETVPDIDVHVESAEDVSGNTQVIYDESDVFSIDTENPTVVALTPSHTLITDSTAGTDVFTLTVDFSEDMQTDGSADPIISFPIENPLNTITFNYDVWLDADTYVAHYDVVDVGDVVAPVDVHIEGAEDDPAGNIQVPYDEADVFSIDTANPTVIFVTPSPYLISDSEVGTNNFTLTVDYSEAMITDGTADPVITFPVEDPLSTITFNNGIWSDSDTYVAYYDVIDADVTIFGIDVHIEGAIDNPDGNLQDPYNEADVFSIDTENPEVLAITPEPELITDSDAGINNFALIVDYSEPMLTDGTADPLITFPVEDPLATITFNHGDWFDANTYMAYYDVVDVDVTLWNIDVHVEDALDLAGNTQFPYDEEDVFSIDTENPEVVSVIPNFELISDSEVGTNTFTLTVGYSGTMLTDGTADPVITFPIEDPLSTIIFNNGSWAYTDTYVAYYDVVDTEVTLPDIDVHVEAAKDDPAGNIQIPYDEADVFSIDTENPLSSVISAIYNPITGAIEVEWIACDVNGIQQVELYLRIEGVDPFVLTDTDVTGNTSGTFYYYLDPDPFICEEGIYEFYTIATDIPGNIETDLDPIVPIEVDIIATSFVITTTPESPEYGTYFSVNVAAVDEAGILDCDYSNVIHFLSNYPDDVTLPNEPVQTYGYQEYDNCISFETMDDLIIEAYGMYPFENHSYSDPIEILSPTIEPPTYTIAYDVPGDEGGWIYIDYVLSLNDPFHSSAEMPCIDYYIVESDADTTAAEDWQAVCDIYLYDPQVGDSASVVIQVPNSYVEYEYRMAAVINQGYQTSDVTSKIGNSKEEPLVIYNNDNRDVCWQSIWAYCGAAAGQPNANNAPTVQLPIADFSFDEDTTDSSIDLNVVFDDEDIPYGDELTFTYDGNTNIGINIEAGIVTLIPAPDWFGYEDITFTATDDSLASISDEVRVTINSVNDTPEIMTYDPVDPVVTINETESQVFWVNATDIDGDILSYQWYVDDVTQAGQTDSIYTHATNYESAGTYMIKCVVDDGVTERSLNISRAVKVDKMVDIETTMYNSRATTYQEWQLNVIDADQNVVVNELVPPEGDLTINEGEVINFFIDAFDPDGNDLDYSWMVDEVEVSVLSTFDFITNENSAGEYTVTLSTTDNFSSRNEMNFLWSVTVIDVVGSGEQLIPVVTKLYQNHPNPFNPITSIQFDIKENETGVISIFNSKGQIIQSQRFNSGKHCYLWNADNYGTGVYFYRLQTESNTVTKKMLLLK